MEKTIIITLIDDAVSVETKGFDNRYEQLGVMRTACLIVEHPSMKYIEEAFKPAQEINPPTSLPGE